MKKQTVTEKQGGKETDETNFTITKKGVEYLSTHDQNIINTVALNEALPYLTISGEDDTGKDRRQRQVRRTALITLANLAGGAIPVQNYTSTKDDTEEQDVSEKATETTPNEDQKLSLNPTMLPC